MVSKGGNKLVLYPEYFDKGRKRAEGRRVTTRLAMPAPTVKQIANAAKKLNLNPSVEENNYPSNWYRRGGRVLVDKKWKKTKLLRKIAHLLKP